MDDTKIDAVLGGFSEFILAGIYRAPRPISISQDYSTQSMKLNRWKAFKMKIPNPRLRTNNYDLYSEQRALDQYRFWAQDAIGAGCLCGDLEGKEFYEDLSNA